jgi:hypothetical protein
MLNVERGASPRGILGVKVLYPGVYEEALPPKYR